MHNIVIIIQDGPYHNNNKAWDALRIAGAALASDIGVKISLLDNGVELGVKNHIVPEGMENLEALLSELIECGMEVMMCGKSMRDYNIAENDMIDGIEKGSMKALAEWMKQSNQVITL